jgi:sulfate permease, SulP family
MGGGAFAGWSNILAGLSGAGYTGSYIFSLTLFSMRMGVDTWACGAVVAAVELALFVLPFSVMNYLPNFFFGALMCWIGFDIAAVWRAGARRPRPHDLMALTS